MIPVDTLAYACAKMKTTVHKETKNRSIERKKKERYIKFFERPKWPIRPNKRLHLKSCLVFENKSK